MDKDEYVFEKFWKDLNEGNLLQYDYMNKKYLVNKMNSNCYFVKLLSDKKDKAQPRSSTISLKTLKEMFPFMENIEYRI